MSGHLTLEHSSEDLDDVNFDKHCFFFLHLESFLFYLFCTPNKRLFFTLSYLLSALGSSTHRYTTVRDGITKASGAFDSIQLSQRASFLWMYPPPGAVTATFTTAITKGHP